MDIVVAKEGAVTTVSLKGRLDGLTSTASEEQLTQIVESGERQIVLDLAELSYVSSVGLRVLIFMAKRLKQLGGRVVVCTLQEPIQQLFEFSGFTAIFPIFATKGEAVRSLE